MYLSEWRNVITESFQDHAAVELVELNVCDLAVCLSLKPLCDAAACSPTFPWALYCCIPRSILCAALYESQTPVQHSVVGVRIGIVTEKAWTSLPDVFAQLIAMQICKVWPFKGMLLNASKAQSKPRTALSKMSTRRVHYFGDEKVAVDGLGMSNAHTRDAGTDSEYGDTDGF